MFKKTISLLALSFGLASSVFAGDLAAVLDAAKTLGSTSGNVAVGVNTEKGKVTAEANASGAGSDATAALAINDDSKKGRNLNIAVGVNLGEANLKATATQGGTARAGLAVNKSK